MNKNLIIHNIKTLYTPHLTPPIKGKNMGDIKSIDNAFVVIKDEKILKVGSGDFKNYLEDNTVLFDAQNKIMLPGLIDSHTHLVHGGSREDEYTMLLKGVPYLEILNQGGGIHNTVQKTREASFDALYSKAYKSLDEMLKFGVVVAESKSGYGLNLETEVKQLEVNQKLDKNHEIKIISTYMGAHAFPKDRRETYVSEIIEDLKVIKAKNLATSCDVFLEDSVFNYEESEKILTAAKNLGFTVKLHADEINSLGGVPLGIKLNATSVDHLMVINDEDINKLANSNTVANLLPATSFYLNQEFAPGRKIIDYGCALSLSTDYNPGSSPTENLQLVMQIAGNKMKLTPEEILTAVTINPAYHLQIANLYGSIEENKYANLILMDAPNLNYIIYHFGINHTTDVFIKGNHVVENKIIRRE